MKAVKLIGAALLVWAAVIAYAVRKPASKVDECAELLRLTEAARAELQTGHASVATTRGRVAGLQSRARELGCAR